VSLACKRQLSFSARNRDMTKECVAAIDQGTSSSRVLIIGSDGSVLGSHQVEHEQFYPGAGQVEHDPLEIWNSVKVCLSGAIASVKEDVRIVSIGITNQRETTIVWNKNTGKPYHRAIVWNDTRTGEICEKLTKAGGADRFRDKTGLPIASYFSATKLMYLLDKVPNLRKDAEKGEALFGTIDTWLMWRLTNGAVHATDVTNASRTMFMDLRTLLWDKDILKELRIPSAMLPQICPSSHLFGNVSSDHKSAFVEHEKATAASTKHFASYHDVPIGGVLGDQNAALFGQACYQPGDSKCTYGTGAFMLFNTGSHIMQSHHGLLTTVAYQLGASKGKLPFLWHVVLRRSTFCDASCDCARSRNGQRILF
jgi:glycerol kinase